MTDCKLDFYTLAVEVTRRCNMNCAHCLRGEAENCDIKEEYYDKLLHSTNAIDEVVFTGGEPTLAIEHIRKFRKLCEKYEIPVYSFYIVTNGKEVSMEFLEELIKWYGYCMKCGGEPEMCGVALSKDNFHAKIPDENETLLRGLSFFREDKFTDFKKIEVINLGRARELVSYRTREPSRYGMNIEDEGTELRIENDVLLTAEGDIVPTCDYEYDEAEEIKIGDVFNMAKFIKYLKECE